MENIIREGSLRLLATESSCDVILSCVGYKLMAHKIILSIASPVLQELLQEDFSQKTVLIFPDIKASIMSLILDYIYSGHVSVLLSELPDFLSIANLLHLKLEEDYLKLLNNFGDVDIGRECKKFIQHNLTIKYKYDDTKYVPLISCKKVMPGLIPINKLRHNKGLFNKVFPSPWAPRKVQIFEDPRKDQTICDYVLPAPVPTSLHKNDSNNNIDLDSTAKDPDASSLLSSDKNPSTEAPLAEQSLKEDRETSSPAATGKDAPQEQNEKPFKCNDCGKCFSQLRNFKYHRSIHDGTKEFSTRCPECGKVFNDRGYLSSHMKIHRDRKEYACQHCPKRFNQRVAYNMHLRIHTGVKPHSCPDCGKSFSRKMLLKQHQRVHTGERPYTCTECGKSFADRSNMSLHARLHTGVKPYSCSVCAKSFTKKHHLKTHMNFHTGLKPYSCQKCGMAFSQSSNMRTHYKKCVTKISAGDT